MERINVSEEFRICQSNCNFKMKFSAKVDMHKACNCDKEYTDFCIRMLELRKFISDRFGKTLTPRELDNLLLYY